MFGLLCVSPRKATKAIERPFGSKFLPKPSRGRSAVNFSGKTWVGQQQLTAVFAPHVGLVADGRDPRAAVTGTLRLVQIDLEAAQLLPEAVVVDELREWRGERNRR